MIIVNKYLVPKKAVAIAIWPFIIFKEKRFITRVRINHEKIHLAQQKELLVIPFYILYAFNFIFNLIFLKAHPYYHIVFEIEAYDNQYNVSYLKNRKFWAWTSHFKSY